MRKYRIKPRIGLFSGFYFAIQTRSFFIWETITIAFSEKEAEMIVEDLRELDEKYR
jgi:hypothetical protein